MSQREPTPVLLVVMPRCPFCDGKKLKPYKRRYYRWGEIHYCKCDLCGRRVNLRREWPLTRKLPG